MALPNFLVIGGIKCASTSLYTYLKQHPEIFMCPRKETRFFCYDNDVSECRNAPMNVFPVRTIEEYESLFEGVTHEKVIGESSPQYLMSWTTPARIKKHLPDVKLIASLRNPVDRAYSAYLMNSSMHDNLPPFVEDFRNPENMPFWHYYEHVKRYFDTFGKDRIKIILQEDLKKDSSGTMSDLFGFLGVDNAFEPDVSERRNLGGVPKNRYLHRVLRKRLNPRAKRMLSPFLPDWVAKFRQDIKSRNMSKVPPLSNEIRAELLSDCRDDIYKLQDLIGRDLTVWLGTENP